MSFLYLLGGVAQAWRSDVGPLFRALPGPGLLVLPDTLFPPGQFVELSQVNVKDESADECEGAGHSKSVQIKFWS